MAGSVHVPFYATGFRGDQLEAALTEISRLSLRYGASHYSVYRSNDDRYKLLAIYHFESKQDWERFWAGKEYSRWRAVHSGWYQVPLLYAWHDVSASGSMGSEAAAGELGGVA